MLWAPSALSYGGTEKTSTTECIRKVVWAEAKGESDAGKRAVAHVVLNRAKQLQKSPCQVVSARGQFVQGRPPANFRVGPLGADPTNGATHFRTKTVRGWLGLRILTRIGGHTFYGK